LADTEFALLFKDQCFYKILHRGIHRFRSLSSVYSFVQYNIMDMAGIELDKKMQMLWSLYPEKFEQSLLKVQTNDDEIALIYQQGQLQNIIGESCQVAFSKAIPELEVKKININQDPCLSTEIDKAIRKANSQIKQMKWVWFIKIMYYGIFWHLLNAVFIGKQKERSRLKI